MWFCVFEGGGMEEKELVGGLHALSGRIKRLGALLKPRDIGVG